MAHGMGIRVFFSCPPESGGASAISTVGADGMVDTGERT